MTDNKAIVIDFVKEYLQGTKTIHEIKSSLTRFPDLDDVPDDLFLASHLLLKVSIDPYSSNELHGLPDFKATRSGLVHILTSYLNGHLTVYKLVEWAEDQICWDIGAEQTDPLIDDIVGDLSIFFNDLDQYLKNDEIERLILLLKANNPISIEQTLYPLSYNHLRTSFSYLLTEYKIGQTENITKFLSKNLKTDLLTFAIPEILEKASTDHRENLKLLDTYYFK